MLDRERRTPAEIYDERFVPALFGQWGERLIGHVDLVPGERVLDVACGTGAATLPAAVAVAPGGHVAGLDANPEMLAVARTKARTIDWVEGMAETLPFGDATFDAVISQFGFMFFEDRARALGEMMRVLVPGGRMAVAVCGDLARSPGYDALARLLDRLFGREVGDAFRAPFLLGDPAEMRAIAAEVLAGFEIEEQTGTVRFASIADLVSTERACVWTLGGLLDEDQFATLMAAAERELAPFTDQRGRVAFDMPAVILTARKE